MLYKQLPYDPDRDLVTISHYLTSPFILVVNPSLPVQSAPEFIKYSKEQSTPLSYSSPAGGGVPAFAVEAMGQRFGLKFITCPIAAARSRSSTSHQGTSNSPSPSRCIARADPRQQAARACSFVQAAPAGAFQRAAVGRGRECSGFRGCGLAHAGGKGGHAETDSQRLNAEMKRIMGRPDAAAHLTWG